MRPGISDQDIPFLRALAIGSLSQRDSRELQRDSTADIYAFAQKRPKPTVKDWISDLEETWKDLETRRLGCTSL